MTFHTAIVYFKFSGGSFAMLVCCFYNHELNIYLNEQVLLPVKFKNKNNNNSKLNKE